MKTLYTGDTIMFEVERAGRDISFLIRSPCDSRFSLSSLPTKQLNTSNFIHINGERVETIQDLYDTESVSLVQQKKLNYNIKKKYRPRLFSKVIKEQSSFLSPYNKRYTARCEIYVPRPTRDDFLKECTFKRFRVRPAIFVTLTTGEGGEGNFIIVGYNKSDFRKSSFVKMLRKQEVEAIEKAYDMARQLVSKMREQLCTVVT